MVAGQLRGALLRLLPPLGALLAALLLAWPAGAAALGPDQPPTARALHRATRELMDDPAYRVPSIPPPQRQSSGGTAPGDLEPSAGALFPDQRLVTLYGAPQLSATALGKRTPGGAARRVVRQAGPYERLGDRDVVVGFDLIGVVATASPGVDGLYRTRQPSELIATYLERARRLGGRLVIDIQPGRSSVREELEALDPWLREPDVDVAIDPEWNVGPRGVPGRTRGTITAKELNRASRRLAAIVAEEGLPPKLMVVHQFRRGSIHHRRLIKQREGVTATLNFDGIGSPAAKEAGYAALARPRLFNGFSLFYDLDSALMSPRSVLALVPEVDFLLYQ